MAIFKRGDTCYILKNNRCPVQAKVVSKSGDLYIIQMVGSSGAIRLPSHRLFLSEEEALNGIVTDKKDTNTETTDVFDGKRFKRNPYLDSIL